MKKDGSILGPICIIFIIAVFVIGLIQDGSELKSRLEDEASIKVIDECEITDKYTKFTAGTKYTASVRRYFYKVVFVTEDNRSHTEVIQTSPGFYNSINVGDTIECKIAYDDEGVFYLEPIENNT